jgi:hypothetical protein
VTDITTIGGGIVGQPAPTPVTPAPTFIPSLYTGPTQGVVFTNVIQTPPAGTNIAVSSSGSWANSVYGGIADAMVKFFSLFKSPSPGYAKQAAYYESAMDMDGKGGLVAGITGVARGFGKINPAGGVTNDIVGVNSVSFKDNDGWAAGVHGEVHDNFPGGVAIGVNGEICDLKEGTHGIGLNIMNWAKNPPADEFILGNGKFKEGIVMEGVSGMQHLLKLSTGGNAIWIYEPKPSVAVVGKLRISLDGQTFYIPVCQ